jgi:hypothetical protein
VKKHFFETQICIALLAVSVFAQAWRIEDRQIRARLDFAEEENHLSYESKGNIFFSTSGFLNTTLEISTKRWDAEDPLASCIIRRALIDDLRIREALLSEGFEWIAQDKHRYWIPPMPKSVTVYPKQTPKPKRNPYPVAS